jgi:hypothetical protein
MRTPALTALVLLTLTVAVAWAAGDDKPKEEKPKADEGAWRSLFDGKTLDGWKQSGFAGEGETTAVDGKIVIPLAERLSGITFTREDLPKSNYEIELNARRVEGSDFFVGLTFPVGESHASLILGGWGGSVCGISSIDHEDASENATRKVHKFKRGQWYKVRLRVEPHRIQAWLDDNLLIDADTTGKKIGIRDEIGPSRPLGLATFATAAEIKSVRMREIKVEHRKE